MRSLSRRKRSRSPKKSPKRRSMSPSAFLRKYQKQLMYGGAGTAGLVGAGYGGRHLYYNYTKGGRLSKSQELFNKRKEAGVTHPNQYKWVADSYNYVQPEPRYLQDIIKKGPKY